MSRRIASAIGLAAALLLAACAPRHDVDKAVADIHALQTANAPRVTEAPPTQPTAAETATPAPVAGPTSQVAALPPFDGNPLDATRGDLFDASGVCAACHTQRTDGAGIDVSFDTLWRTTMMANSARDPYWQASVRRETLQTPGLKAVIEDTCSRCHMPMARTSAVAAGGQGVILDDGFLSPDNPLHALAMDGVSCSACHQIEADQLGERATFDGNYIVDLQTAMGQRSAYGPFAVDPQNAQVMQAAAGLVPVQGAQIQQAELCATCHTLYTPYVDADGNAVGEFPEQMPYFEWKASSYSGQQTCQACHMPEATGAVVLSITGGPARQPVLMHTFTGGGSTVLGELRADGADLGVTASSVQFDTELARMEQQLQISTATVAVQDAALDGSTLSANVVINSLVGHKFPSAYPSRRVWLHITVTDSTGKVVFESGAYGQDGAISGNANDDDPASYEPHYTTLTSPDEVQIYEAVMVNTDQEVTTTLLRAASYVKDNRLLPAGFDKAAADADIAVTGAALEDGDFVAGGDTLQLAVDTGNGVGPFTLNVELLYQSVGFRWADNVLTIDAPENAAFAHIYEHAGNVPVVVGTAAAQVGQ